MTKAGILITASFDTDEVDNMEILKRAINRTLESYHMKGVNIIITYKPTVVKIAPAPEKGFALQFMYNQDFIDKEGLRTRTMSKVRIWEKRQDAEKYMTDMGFICTVVEMQQVKA